MKKFSTEMQTVNGERKTITVWLDDETSRLLDKYGDEKLRHEYIVEEYKAHLIERRETRRHQSLEIGYEFADLRADIEQLLESQEEKGQLYKALKGLTRKQINILKLHVVKKKTFKKISEMLSLNPSTVKEHFYTALKKLKKFFN